jgi:hypothetical protein
MIELAVPEIFWEPSFLFLRGKGLILVKGTGQPRDLFRK